MRSAILFLFAIGLCALTAPTAAAQSSDAAPPTPECVHSAIAGPEFSLVVCNEGICTRVGVMLYAHWQYLTLICDPA